MQLYEYDQNSRFDRSYSSNVSTIKECLTSPPLSINDDLTSDRILERKCVLSRNNYKINLADSPARYSQVNKLIKSMYSWRGYPTDSAPVGFQNSNQLTLEASIAQRPVGTLTVRLDSEEGMLADALYEQEIQLFRQKGNKLCELSKLAIDPLNSSKELFASLVNLAYIYARRIHKVKDAFIEVNPRHAGFYKRMLGFHLIGEKRTCRRVDAPAVLMHLRLDYMDEQISCLAGSPNPAKERSLYAYFLTKREEDRVVDRLRTYVTVQGTGTAARAKEKRTAPCSRFRPV